MEHESYTILITGATGFVGSHLARAFARDGHRVHILVREQSPDWRIRDIAESISMHTCDLLDAATLANIVKAMRPDFIFHCANAGVYGGVAADDSTLLETNVIGLMNLLAALRELPYRGFINFGSSSEYGPKDRPMREIDLCEPANFYGVTKLSATHVARLEALRYDKPILTLRLFSPFGPYDDHCRLISRTIADLLEKKPLGLRNPEARRDYIYIDDVVDVCKKALACTGECRGEVFNVGSGVEKRIADVVDALVPLTGADPSLVSWSEGTPGKDESPRWEADIEKTSAFFSWRPRYTLEQGLAETCRWMKEHCADEREAAVRASPKPAKVTIVVNELLRGGAQRIIYDIARTIDRASFQLHIIYLKEHRVFDPSTKTLSEEIASTGVRITSAGGERKFSCREFANLKRLLAEDAPDIVHTFLPYAGIAGRVAARLAGVRRIMSTQCNLPVAYSPKVYWLDRLTLPLANAWTGATEAIEEAYGGSIAYVAPESWKEGRRHYTIVGGVDPATLHRTLESTDRARKRESLGIPSNAPVIMMTARLISWKGHEDLIDAMADIAPEAHLVLVGWGPLEAELKARADLLGVERRVHFLGARTDVYELLAIADVYVQSHGYAPDGEKRILGASQDLARYFWNKVNNKYPQGVQRRYGDVWKGPNLSQVEACAAGVPSVSTSVPLVEYLIEDGVTGTLAKPNDPKDLARAINWVLEHPEEAKARADVARKRVDERYTTQAMVRQYETLYRLLTGKAVR